MDVKDWVVKMQNIRDSVEERTPARNVIDLTRILVDSGVTPAEALTVSFGCIFPHFMAANVKHITDAIRTTVG